MQYNNFLLVLVLVGQLPFAFFLRKLFIALNLVDSPCLRKRHSSLVPFSGGLSLYIFLAFFMSLNHESRLAWAVFTSSFLVLLVSFIDDIRHVSSHIRLLSQIISITLFIILLQGVWPANWFSLVSPASFQVELVEFFLFIVIGTGIINAFNMSDGIDGLCAGYGFLANLSFAHIFYAHGFVNWAQFCLYLSGTLLIFSFFNFSSRYKTFLGDSGSTLLGFMSFAVLAIMVLKLNILGLGSAVWFVAFPLMDMARVVFLRLARKKSPLNADRAHIHHLLQDHGWSKHATVAFILACQLVFCAVGLVLHHASAMGEMLSILVFFLAFIVFFVITSPYIAPLTALSQRLDK
jgi:UDP-GlcNAc:undecaprenyl-phosphate/decaprenyl-phosphate GlcNAc-1-phosphate transferase